MITMIRYSSEYMGVVNVVLESVVTKIELGRYVYGKLRRLLYKMTG